MVKDRNSDARHQAQAGSDGTPFQPHGFLLAFGSSLAALQNIIIDFVEAIIQVFSIH